MKSLNDYGQADFQPKYEQGLTTMMKVESTAQNLIVTDESGYAFKIECKQGEHDGWSGQMTLHCKSLMVHPSAVLEHILAQAKQFVRIMEFEARSTWEVEEENKRKQHEQMLIDGGGA